MTFALDLQKFAEKVGARADRAVGHVVADVARELDERSPVGDASYWTHPAPKGYIGGRFRANWQMGVDSVPQGTLDRIDHDGTIALPAIIAEIPTHAAGKLYSMVNNVPYAMALEEGHSRQAPQGLVSLTAIGWQGKVDAAVKALP